MLVLRVLSIGNLSLRFYCFLECYLIILNFNVVKVSFLPINSVIASKPFLLKLSSPIELNTKYLS